MRQICFLKESASCGGRIEAVHCVVFAVVLFVFRVFRNTTTDRNTTQWISGRLRVSAEQSGRNFHKRDLC